MLASLKSEFRKLLTVRSTYLITGFVVLLVSFLSFWVFGYKTSVESLADPTFMREMLYNLFGVFVTFATIIAILHVAHEYRYNMITYTLTASRSRVAVLTAKTIVLLTYATIAGLAVLAISYVGIKLGISLRDVTLVDQTIPGSFIWQLGAYLWGYVLTGIIIAVLIRGLVGSIVAYFLIPTVEQLISLWLKTQGKYLPFRSLEAIAASNTPTPLGENLSHTTALIVFSVYLAIFGTIAVVSFVKRDAN